MMLRPCSAKRISKGFTLIEILVVILIISVISGIALVTVSGNQQKQLETLAHQLTRLITLAEEEAMLRPSTLGLGLSHHHFQFFEYTPALDEENPWEELTSKSLGLHTLPDFITIKLCVNKEHTPLDGKPHIIISESGDITPFTITIAKADDEPSYVVKGDANGNVVAEAYHEE